MPIHSVATARGHASGPLEVVQTLASAPARKPQLVPKSQASVGSYWVLVTRYVMAIEGYRTPQTVKGYTFDLNLFGSWLESRNHSCEIEQISRTDVQAFVAHRAQASKSAATIRRNFAVLSRFFSAIADEPEIPEGWKNPTTGVKTPRVVVEPPPVLERSQVDAMMVGCEAGAKNRLTRFESLRDAAMLAILWDVGLRVGELANMTLEDAQAAVALSSSRTRGFLRVTGKTGPREVFLTRKTCMRLDRYLAVYKEHVQRGRKLRDERDQVRGTGLWLGKFGPLTGGGIRRILKKRAKAVGIERWWTHLMRHTSVHEQLKAGAREHHVMRIMGWKSTAMLERYGAAEAVERALAEHRDLDIGGLI